MSNIEEKIISLLEQHFYKQKGKITKDTMLEEVVNDSMDFIELVSILTTEFGIRVLPEDVKDIKKVGDVISFVEKKPKSSIEDSMQKF